MQGIWMVLLGSFLLSIIHALIPNHWVPLVVIGKAEQWTNRQLTAYTVITGFAHTLSTVLIGIVVGVIGIRLSQEYGLIVRIAAPAILVGLGAVYSVLNVHQQKHPHDHLPGQYQAKGSRRAILFSLIVAMFFSPCTEIEAYYFTASRIGWAGIWIVSIVYTVVTVAGMVLLTGLGRKGMEKLQLHFLEHHERAITGGVLIVLGFAAFLFLL